MTRKTGGKRQPQELIEALINILEEAKETENRARHLEQELAKWPKDPQQNFYDGRGNLWRYTPDGYVFDGWTRDFQHIVAQCGYHEVRVN